jgi:starch phosphorylase
MMNLPMDRYVPLPPLPVRIGRLNELAYDLWWSWNQRAREVFRDLDYPLWRFTDHNPVLLLHLVEPDRLEHAADDPQFLALYDDAIAGLDAVRSGSGTWWSHRMSGHAAPIACVTEQFALHQSLPVNVRREGVLSGDFCREAGDLGIPIVGVGLMYPRGYFHQRLSAEGWQQENYEYIDWSDAPIGPASCPDGTACAFGLPLGSDVVQVVVWRVQAGRVTLYLLDTDVQENSAWDRELSSKSFAEGSEARLRQSMLLGAGAVRALERLDIEPAVWHAVSGAAALVTLERLNRAVAAGEPYPSALARIARSTVFSTRDTAPAPGDSFSFAAMDRQMAFTWPTLMPHRDAVFDLGRHDGARGVGFNVSLLSVHASGVVNVPESAAGESAQAAWQQVTATAGADPAAVRSIADGVHLSSWISADLARVFDEYVGQDWRERQDDPVAWEEIRRIPADAWWSVRQRLRGYLVDFIRERARRRWAREQASGNRLVALGTLLDASTLTIGFARRMTESARPRLLFHDLERLARLVTAARRPVQIVFAGKADPEDESGKHHLQRLFRHTLDPAFGGRVAFLEDYDLHVARLLVQGCDVWLSTPRRDAQLSISIGGLKASVNGVPHLATADAWWLDGYTGKNGWMIDGGRARDAGAQDVADARALYRLLEDQIVPAFYDRDRAGLPEKWTALMAEAIATTVPRFCARRTVKSFAEVAYLPAINAVSVR